MERDGAQYDVSLLYPTSYSSPMHILNTYSDIDTSLITPTTVLLDTGATLHIFKTKHLLTNLRELHSEIQLVGIGGTLSPKRCGDFNKMGILDVLQHNRAPANVLSFDAVQANFPTRFIEAHN